MLLKDMRDLFLEDINEVRYMEAGGRRPGAPPPSSLPTPRTGAGVGPCDALSVMGERRGRGASNGPRNTSLFQRENKHWPISQQQPGFNSDPQEFK